MDFATIKLFSIMFQYQQQQQGCQIFTPTPMLEGGVSQVQIIRTGIRTMRDIRGQSENPATFIYTSTLLI